MGGVGEIPLDGVRSPWTRPYIGTRVESTMSGVLRVGVGGRVEQALLLGVRARGFSISTMQGMSRTGNGGIALYGHGTLGFQLGYLF